jgi:hypothetical protein
MKWTRQRCQAALRTLLTGLDSLTGIRDHQLDAAQAAAGELAQKRGPERLGLGRADIHAQHLAPAAAACGQQYTGCETDKTNHRGSAISVPYFSEERFQ